MCQCPKCNSRVLRRKKKCGILKILPKTKMYKCFQCKTLFIRFIPTETFFITSKPISKEAPISYL